MVDEARSLAEVRGGLIAQPGAAASVDPEETTPWEPVRARRIGARDWRRFEGYMAEIFAAFGMELETPATERTPQRFLKALYDATAGYEGDHKFLTTFPTECRCGADCIVSHIIEGPISFSKTVTTVWRGGYAEDAGLRRELLAAVRNRDPWR
jgi:GTP cyclohydrolase I